jgi:plasmid maintenance system antidote protein VapI
MRQVLSIADPAAELRAEIARQRIAIYRLAPIVGLHPSHLGQVLSGRRPLSPDLAARLQSALCNNIDCRQTKDAIA